MVEESDVNKTEESNVNKVEESNVNKVEDPMLIRLRNHDRIYDLYNYECLGSVLMYALYEALQNAVNDANH